MEASDLDSGANLTANNYYLGLTFADVETASGKAGVPVGVERVLVEASQQGRAYYSGCRSTSRIKAENKNDATRYIPPLMRFLSAQPAGPH